eukprot:7384860-Prymnesium_polylepis.2
MSGGALRVVGTTVSSSSAYMGGGIVIETSAVGTITDTDVVGCIGFYGGGIVILNYGSILVLSSSSVSLCEGRGAEIWEGGGGVVANYGSSVVVIGCTITQCHVR